MTVDKEKGESKTKKDLLERRKKVERRI